VSWAIRNGEDEIGFTFHYMDAELDTGNILAQAPIALDDEHSWDELTPKIADAVGGVLPGVLERVERGEPGEPQDESRATYCGAFEPEFARIDRTRSRAEIARQVRAWRFQPLSVEPRGALAEVDGETVRVLRVGVEPGEGVPMECGDGTLWIMESEPA
jgi:methionyl-tRNA formyltransferase